MMWFGSGGWGWGGWLLMSVAMVLFWAVLITAIVVGIRYLTNSPSTASHAPSSGPSRAEDLLSERFARGEIDADEFRQRHALLREH
ncbi:SHOCT domain-containing protein [Mycolicibacterium hodleri]